VKSGGTFIYLATLIGCLNIILNLLAKRAAAKSISWFDGLLSSSFIAAFFIGCLSISLMVLFYRNAGDSLARGLILMGAVSIVGGSVFSIFVLHQSIDPIEKMIICAIAGLLFIKWLKLVTTSV
jgi:hypothetical protein